MTPKTILNDLVPFKAVHVGEVLKDELDARGIKQKELAAMLEQPAPVINHIINGTRSITAEMAILLEKALGISASFWMELHSNFLIDTARINEQTKKKAQNIELWKIIEQYVPVKAFTKAGVLGKNIGESITKVFEIFGVKNIDELISLKAEDPQLALFKKSEKCKTDQMNLFGWKYLAYYHASQDSTEYPSFNPNTIGELIQELNTIFYTNTNVPLHLKETLHKYGIRFIVQKKFDQTPIDGFSFIQNDTPTIVITMRLDKIDNLAFSVMHELCHVFYHLNQEEYSSTISIDKKKRLENSSYEKEADSFAQSALINKDIWNDFMRIGKSINPYQISEVIRQYADKYKINPAILFGAYTFAINKYNIRNSFDKKIG